MGLWLSSVAAVAHAVAVGELVDGALDAGADRVALVPVGVCWSARSRSCRSWSSRGGKPTVRLPSPEVVQAALAGQGWHWLLVKRATMSGAAAGEEVG